MLFAHRKFTSFSYTFVQVLQMSSCENITLRIDSITSKCPSPSSSPFHTKARSWELSAGLIQPGENPDSRAALGLHWQSPLIVMQLSPATWSFWTRCLLLEFQINEVTSYAVFPVWYVPLCITLLSFIQVTLLVCIFFFFCQVFIHYIICLFTWWHTLGLVWVWHCYNLNFCELILCFCEWIFHFL